MYKHIIATIFMLCVAGCSSTGKKEIAEENPKVLYKTGKELLSSENYKQAIAHFEKLEREHPASKLAPEAHILRAYAYYSSEEFDDAVAVIEEFTRTYPVHENIAYMYYLKAMSYYDRILDLERDQDITEQALLALKEVVNRFPNSSYAKDAKWKIEYAFNTLAGKEMAIGRFYLSRYKYIAALNRFKNIVANYDTTIFIPEAIYRIVEVYSILGVKPEALRYSKLLNYNFPDSTWNKKANMLIYEQTG